jgi:hypothetical protein
MPSLYTSLNFSLKGIRTNANNLSSFIFSFLKRPTVCVRGLVLWTVALGRAWIKLQEGDSVRARKMLENAAESPPSRAYPLLLECSRKGRGGVS